MSENRFSSTDRENAYKLDQQDELSSFRSLFVDDEPDVVYLNGNSLGRLPERTVTATQSTLREEWGTGLIRSWNRRWYDMPGALGSKIAKLIGAEADEVVVSDSTTLNLYKLTCGALRAFPDRPRIVTDTLNFPSNLYVLQAVAAQAGEQVQFTQVQSQDGISLSLAELINAVDDRTVLLYLSHVSYKSGFLYDMAAVTRAAHEAGALVLWDLSHSVGTVPIQLNECQADLAVGCTYKYLNGGPGAPAFLYVKKALQQMIENPIWGWFGAERPFAFSSQFEPAEGIRRYLVGTPPILSMQAIEPAVNLILEAKVERIREKSILLTEYLLFLTEQWLLPLGFELASPSNPLNRGSHVTLRHPESYRISQALMNDSSDEPQVITDFREPDNLRLGVAALYNSFQDIHLAANRIRAIAAEHLYEDQSPSKREVT